jgi:hypothetical protein
MKKWAMVDLGITGRINTTVNTQTTTVSTYEAASYRKVKIMIR